MDASRRVILKSFNLYVKRNTYAALPSIVMTIQRAIQRSMHISISHYCSRYSGNIAESYKVKFMLYAVQYGILITEIATGVG